MNGLVLKPRFAGGNFAETVDKNFRFHLARQNAMGSTPEQVKRELFVRSGRDHHDLQLRGLPQEFGYRFHRIGRQSRLKDQHVCGKLGHCGLRLRQSLGLADHANVVFKREDLAQAGAEDGLRIGQDHANQRARAAALVSAVIFSHADRSRHQFSCTYARSKWYSSITTPTPRRP